MLHLIILVGMNNPRKSCWEVQRINIQEGSQLFSIFLSWNFCEQNCAWFVNKMDISCFHKRKIEKSWLPSSILIPYAFQHDFLGLFIRVKNMRCSILSQVENFSVKINLKVELKEKTFKWKTFDYNIKRGKVMIEKCFGKNQFESRIKRKNTASIHSSFTFHQGLLSADWQILN